MQQFHICEHDMKASDAEILELKEESVEATAISEKIERGGRGMFHRMKEKTNEIAAFLNPPLEKLKSKVFRVPQVNVNVSKQKFDWTPRIQVLEEQSRQHQEEMVELKGKQQKLIKESLELFIRHETQLEDLLPRLEDIEPIQKENLQNLFKDVKGKVKKLAEENDKKPPNLELCNDYLVDAGRSYQSCYAYILELIGPKMARQKELHGANVKSSSDIGVHSSCFSAGSNLFVGNGNILMIQQTAEQGSKETKEIEEDANKIKNKYTKLYQSYQENLEELDSIKKDFERQKASWTNQERIFFDQIEAEKIAAEKQASEQEGKIGAARQETEKLKAEAEKTKKKMEDMQKRIAQLEAEFDYKTEQIEKTKAGDGADSKNLSFEPDWSEERNKLSVLQSVLHESQYDEYRILRLVLKEIPDKSIIVWQVLAVLAKNLYCTEQKFVEILDIVKIAGLKDKDSNVRQAAHQTLLALVGNPHCTEQRFGQLLDIVKIAALKDKNSDIRQDAQQTLRVLADNPRCTEQTFTRLLNTVASVLEDESCIWQAIWQTLFVLVDNPRCTEQTLRRLLTTVTNTLKDAAPYIQQAILQNLDILANNPHCTASQFVQLLITVGKNSAVLQNLATLADNPYYKDEQEFKQLLVTAIAALKDKEVYIRQAASKTLAALANNAHCTALQFAQLLEQLQDAVNNPLNGKESWHVRRAAEQALLVTLANNTHSTEPFAQLLSMTITLLAGRTTEPQSATLYKNSEDSIVQQNALQILLALAGNPRCTEQSFTQLLAAVIASLQDKKWIVQQAALRTLTALASNPRCTEESFAQLLAAATAFLNDKNSSVRQAVLQILAVLANNSYCTEPQFAQLLAIATAGLQDKNSDVQRAALHALAALVNNSHYDGQPLAQLLIAVTATASLRDNDLSIRRAASKTLAALANNPHCTEQTFMQLFTAVTTALKDENWDIRKVGLQTLTMLVGSSYFTEQHFTQLFIAADMQDKSLDVRQATLQTLVLLASNPHCTEPQFEKLFTTAITAMKDEDRQIQETALQILAALASYPHLSFQKNDQICLAILSDLKDGSRQKNTKDALIRLIQKCSTGQLLKYTALANALMKDADAYIQLIAIFMLATIQQRCQNELALPPVNLETKAEPEDKKDEEVLDSQAASEQNTPELEEQARATPQSTPAEAATKMGLMPKPKEHVAANKPAQAALTSALSQSL